MDFEILFVVYPRIYSTALHELRLLPTIGDVEITGNSTKGMDGLSPQ